MVMKPKPRPPLTSQTYVWLTIRQLWENLPQLIWGGVLFTILSLPAIILAMLSLPRLTLLMTCLFMLPAWSALLAQQSLLAQDKLPKWDCVPRMFARYWGRSCRFALLLVIPTLILQITMPTVVAQANVPPIVLIGLLANSFLILLLFAIFIYSLPLLVQYDLPFRTALRHGFVLSGRYASHTLGLLCIAALFLWATLSINQALFFILPFVWSLFVVNNCRLVVNLEEEKEKT